MSLILSALCNAKSGDVRLIDLRFFFKRHSRSTLVLRKNAISAGVSMGPWPTVKPPCGLHVAYLALTSGSEF